MSSPLGMKSKGLISIEELRSSGIVESILKGPNVSTVFRIVSELVRDPFESRLYRNGSFSLRWIGFNGRILAVESSSDNEELSVVSSQSDGSRINGRVLLGDLAEWIKKNHE